MIEEEKTVMDRVANAWITFCVTAGLLGAISFASLSWGFEVRDWVSTLSAVIIGVGGGLYLAKFRWARLAVGLLLYAIGSVSWTS